MAVFSSPHSDLFCQSILIVFMEVYLYFQELYPLMGVTMLFVVMGMGYRTSRCGTRVCIIVLGDIGRSPRMQYHALSFAGQDFQVEIVGYGGSKPRNDLLTNEWIKLHIMSNPPTLNTSGLCPSFLQYSFKVLWQSVQLVWVLLVKMKWPSHILIQTPPAIPTLAIGWFCSRLYGSKFMIDWHNYGYTILGLTLGQNHFLVRFSKWFEGVFGRWGDGHLCVTNAMKEDLNKKWGIKRPITLYDRPPNIFKKTPVESQHELFTQLASDYPVFGPSNGVSNATAFTEKTADNVVKCEHRPALIVSSTSWTEDEDFSVLLEALQLYDQACQVDVGLPHVVCAITGKGPMKEYYQDKIAQIEFQHVQLCTPWLTAEDYPLLIGAGDLGICLHTSSSGLDLPMKVVDMFGSGLPVCAMKFNCIGELVKHGENGLVFSSADELAQQLQDVLQGFPKDNKHLENFRANLRLFQAERWEDNWIKIVRPTLYV